jgi:hypothetical protein
MLFMSGKWHILSSIIKVEVSSHLFRTKYDFFIRRASTSADSLPKPIPANECTVLPPMLRPAIPVEAVMAMDSGKRSRSKRMISRRRTDFPVPARHQYSRDNEMP